MPAAAEISSRMSSQHSDVIQINLKAGLQSGKDASIFNHFNTYDQFKKQETDRVAQIPHQIHIDERMTPPLALR